MLAEILDAAEEFTRGSNLDILEQMVEELRPILKDLRRHLKEARKDDDVELSLEHARGLSQIATAAYAELVVSGYYSCGIASGKVAKILDS